MLPSANSGTLDLAMGMAPLYSNIETEASEALATLLAKTGNPSVIRMPLTSLQSYTVMSNPHSKRSLFAIVDEDIFFARSGQYQSNE